MSYILFGSHLLFDRSPRILVYVFRHQSFCYLRYTSLEYNCFYVRYLITFCVKLFDMMVIKFVLCFVIILLYVYP